MAHGCNHVGVTKMMHCGLNATVIKYDNWRNIVVEFEDGTKKNTSWGSFNKCSVAHPNISSVGVRRQHDSEEQAKQRLGDRKLMNCGEFAEIIEYNSYKDIMVQFDTGEKKRTSYDLFKKGTILKPGLSTRMYHLKDDRVGEKVKQECGLVAEIIAYNSSINIDVRFEDGCKVHSVDYGDFINGKIQRIKAKSGTLRYFRCKEEHTGETAEQHHGGVAKIVEYRGTNDIDVCFEDGTKVCNVSYTAFKSGRVNKVSNEQKKVLRVGISKKMNCGLVATIVEYRSCKDITVEFEDGFRKDCDYYSFKNGSVARYSDRVQRRHIGEKKVMNCGLEATIIDYRGSKDIDVELSNGKVLKGRKYTQFQRGSLGRETVVKSESHVGERKKMSNGFWATIVQDKDGFIKVKFDNNEVVNKQSYEDFERGNIDCRLGKKGVMNCGLEAEIIRYGSATDIDVKFSNGIVRCGVSYYCFKKGGIRPSDTNDYKRVGETRVMNCGEEVVIIAYRSFTDIDIKFPDGTVKEHCNYARFEAGKIAKPAKSHLGERVLMNCGEYATVVCCNSGNDITIKFDDGVVREHVRYSKFIRGEVPKKAVKHSKPVNHVGERRLMNCGEFAKIINYEGYNNVDVEFEDGTKRFNCDYKSFLTGGINKVKKEKLKPEDMVGTRKKMNCGIYATITAFRNSHDMDIRFDDGVEKFGVSYSTFKDGSIGRNASKESCIGTTKLMNNGLYCTVVDFNSVLDIELEFEDGTRVGGRLDSFNRGTIKHPLLRSALKLAYTFGGKRYFTYDYGEHRYLGTASELVWQIKSMNDVVKEG